MNLTSQSGYFFKIFVTLSLLLCSLFGGQQYESACAAAWRLRNDDNFIKRTWAKSTIWLMDYFEDGHCRISAGYYKRIQFGLKHSLSQQKRIGRQS